MNDSRGNAALEMLLATPLALLFLFVVTDTGLGLLDGAALRDTVRAGVLGQAESTRTTAVLALDVSGTYQELNPEDFQESASTLAERLEQQLLYAQSARLGGDRASEFAVSVTPVTVPIDSGTGRVVAEQLRLGSESISASSVPRSALDCGEQLASREFILQELKLADRGQPARFATPVGSSRLPSSVEYLPQALLFYVSVAVYPEATNRAYSLQVLRRQRAVCEQQLVELRNYVR